MTRRTRQASPEREGGSLRAALYARVSTEKQAEDKATSIPEQIRRDHDYADRKGWQVVATFKDEGASGTVEDRPAWLQVKAAARAGEIDVIVVLRWDRHARDAFVGESMVRDVKALGIALAVVEDGSFITALLDDDVFMRQIKLAVAQKYRDDMVKATANGAYAKARDGRWPSSGRAAPFGLRVEGAKRDARLVLDEDETATANRAADLLVDEGRPPADVCWLLNNAAMLPRIAPIWTTTILRDMLSQRSLIGEVWWGKTEHHASGKYGAPVLIPDVPAVLTPERFELVQQALARSANGPRPEGRDWPLSGGRMTSPCGRTYTGRHRHDRDWAQYKCQGRRWQRGDWWKPCGCPLLDAGSIESRVWSAVTDLLSDGDRLRALAKEYLGLAGATPASQVTELALLDRQVAQLSSRISVAMTDGVRAGLDPEALAVAVEQLQGELAALRTRRDDIARWAAESEQRQSQMDSLDALASHARSRLRTMSLADRARVLDLLEVRVTVLDESDDPALRIAGVVCDLREPRPDQPTSVSAGVLYPFVIERAA